MFKILLSLLLMLYTAPLFAQHTFKAAVKDSISNQAVAGATVAVKGTAIGATSSAAGEIFLPNVPAGRQMITFSCKGYQTIELEYQFPLADNLTTQTIFLVPDEEVLDEVVVSSTRTSRTIRHTPTRVEMIELEEIDEKSNMRPANVSMLLHESTGIQVQQTSATSGNASIRLQGLDGRYTQLLKDGYASFGNFAGGLSVLEIPPLDLKQVEIIKGPASTLYSAGAIAGVVNFISKSPRERPEYSFIINGSNVGQLNLGGYASGRTKKQGYSILAQYNHQQLYDVDGDDFTELPKSTDFTLHPKLYLYPNDRTTLVIGNSFTKSSRTGGDVVVIEGKPNSNHTYFETNHTVRNTATFDYMRKLTDNQRLTAKAGFGYFDRSISIPDYSFQGANYNFFSDVSYVKNLEQQTLIVGGNLIYDRFVEQQRSNPVLRNFKTTTGGVYAQHTWDISERLKLESGLRTDAVTYSNPLYRKTEAFILPRLSLLALFNAQWSSRIGGGLGYKTPTLFTEQTETFQYQDIAPLNGVSSERSSGATADINFKTAAGGDFSFNLNQMFFVTRISNSSILKVDGAGVYSFTNTKEPVISKGFETNVRLIFKEDLKFFVGYTFTHAKAAYLDRNQFLPLLPQSKLNLALVYEKERQFKMGLEAYFTGRQYLYNGDRTASFWEVGFMAEKTFGKTALFINAENFTDTRQSRYKPVVNGPHQAPVFDDIWTHTEGRTFNGGVKIKL